MYRVIFGDVRKALNKIESESIQCIVTSPPYWNQRDYGLKGIIWDDDKSCNHSWNDYILKPSGGKGSKSANVGANKNDFVNMRDHEVVSQFCNKCNAWIGQLGLEPTVEMYVNHICDVFDQCFRVLSESGTLFLNLGDTYIGSGKGAGTKTRNKQSYKINKRLIKEDLNGWKKQKQLALVPSRVAIEMQNRGWILRNDLIWHKPNAMPDPVKDRFTVDYEHIFLFVKNRKYKFNQVLEPKANSLGERNKRSIWSINTKNYKEAHFAVFNEDLITPMILAGSDENDLVLDPFVGSGTTIKVCKELNRNCIGIELNKNYKNLIRKRLKNARTDNRTNELFKRTG